jgi:hypothetical protein
MLFQSFIQKFLQAFLQSKCFYDLIDKQGYEKGILLRLDPEFPGYIHR